MARCTYCGHDAPDMDRLTDHVAAEHNAIRAAITGDINHLVDELQAEPAKP